MRAGTLREVVRLQSRTLTYSADSLSDAETWATYATVRASVRSPMRTSEREIANALQAVDSYVVEVRGGQDVSPSHRVLWGTKVLQVGTIERDPRGRWLRLYCTEASEGE